MSETYPIKMTQLESLYLSDSISVFSQGPPEASGARGSPYPDLLLKIGSAVLETDQRSGPVTLCLTLKELWMVREVAKSSAVVGSERVGLNLLLKAYSGIRALTAATEAREVLDALGEVAHQEPGRDDYASRLDSIKSGEDPSAEGRGSEDVSDESDDRHGHDQSKQDRAED